MAVAEAKSMLEVSLDDVRVLSIGTSDEVTNLPSRLTSGCLVQWATHATRTMLRAQAVGNFHAALHLVGPERVVRVDEPVPPRIFRLDRNDVTRMRGLAEGRARHVCPLIKPFTTHIAPPFTPIP